MDSLRAKFKTPFADRRKTQIPDRFKNPSTEITKIEFNK